MDSYTRKKRTNATSSLNAGFFIGAIMAKVTLEIGVTSLPLSAGEVLTNWHFNVVEKAGALPPLDTEVPDPKVELEIAPGDYTASAWRINNNGEVFGDKATADFTIPVPAMGDAAGSLTVTL